MTDRFTQATDGLAIGHRIAGHAVPGQGMRFAVFDPGRAAAIGEIAYATATEVDECVAASKVALRNWKKFRPVQRARILATAARLLAEQTERIAIIESVNVGKPLREARGDVATAARFLEYYAGIADKLEGESIPLGPDMFVWTEREPAGVTAHIVPWNSPLAMLARGVAPALAAGCTAIVKPAELTPYSALIFADVMKAAGLPDGVLNVVNGSGPEAGARLAAHPGVDHITFTGSVATGKAVMAAAATHLATVTLELGGKSPLVILKDADLDAAIAGIARGIYTNAGQICAAGSRVIVDRAVFDEVASRLAAQAGKLRLGYGLDDPDLGPLASSAQLLKVETDVRAARAGSAKLICGGARGVVPGYAGHFFQPTILSVTQDDPLARKEVFGPVLALVACDGLDQAITIANDSDYGLVGGIYTRDISAALRFAREVEVGQVFVNKFLAGGVETPVGGVKNSGFGREKGLRGLDSYLRTKCVTVTV